MTKVERFIKSCGDKTGALRRYLKYLEKQPTWAEAIKKIPKAEEVKL